MKKTVLTKFSFLAAVMCSLIFFSSCGSDDDASLKDKEFHIKYHISCSNPTARMHIDATGLDEKGGYAKNTYENELNTKDYFAVIKVRCDDPKAVVSVELYVNNELRAKRNCNSPAFISERLKGKGPYLE